jgi:heat shock protein HslJ
MKRVLLLLLTLPLLLTACGASKSAFKGAAPVESDLLARRFVLQSVSGVPFNAGERRPEIEFNEGMSVSGQVCNRFIGKGIYEKGVLTVPNMAMTMMLCVDDTLNQLEGAFAAMLREGVRVDLQKNVLTLSDGKTTLLYSAE